MRDPRLPGVRGGLYSALLDGAIPALGMLLNHRHKTVTEGWQRLVCNPSARPSRP